MTLLNCNKYFQYFILENFVTRHQFKPSCLVFEQLELAFALDPALALTPTFTLNLTLKLYPYPKSNIKPSLNPSTNTGPSPKANC